MFKSFHVEIEKDRFLNQLKQLESKEINRIVRRMMVKTLAAIRKDASQNIRSQLSRQSGNLLKSFKIRGYEDFTAFIKNKAIYASVHERGAIILPKKGKYLTFKIGDEFKKVESVEIPKREFLWNTMEDYFLSTNKAAEIMDRTLQEALEKLFQ